MEAKEVIKLIDLDAEFVRWEDRPNPAGRAADGFSTETAEDCARWTAAGCPRQPSTYLPTVATLAEAQGVVFDCPKCRNHSIMIAFQGRGVLDHQATRASNGRPTRWNVVGGSGLQDLSLSPSIDCTPSNPNCWHGFVTNGVAT